MMRCRHWRSMIPEAVYGDLDAKARQKLERHLERCGDCAALAAGMAAAVGKMAVRPAPDRPARYWEGYWDRLEARMAREPAAAPPRRPFQAPAWAYGAAGAVLFVALGIFLGRTVFRTGTDGPAIGPAVSSVAPAAFDASRYLKRSRVLILAVLNSDRLDEEDFQLHLPLQKATSARLLREAAVLKKGLGSSDRRLETLVSDLERVLLQIANLAPDAGAADVEIIRAGVEDRDILFKINLNETLRPGRGRDRAPGAGLGGPAPAAAGPAAKA